MERRTEMPQNLLKNGDFEADWGDEQSHRCLVFPAGAAPHTADVENIFTPPDWVVWFHHKPGTWDQPEVRDAWQQNDPYRVHGGQKGMLLFTFFRGHDAGFFQQVQITPGTRLRLAAWAHAWSNHKVEGYDKYGNARCSVGVGCGAAYIEEDQTPPLNGDPLNDAIGNFTFSVGIDPTGGTNPFASTVVWGKGAHIYNEYHQTPAVEATAQGDTVTVFLRSKTLWAFENSDSYWDDAELTVVGAEPLPEVQLIQSPAGMSIDGTVKFEARSQTALADPRLVVRRPAGAELAQVSVVAGRDGDWYTWTYTIPPQSEAGTYQVEFSAAGGVHETATFAYTPPVRPPRGLPREQYRRIYVLLPPDADVAWAAAVVDATWNQSRYTVGSSADDAGIGDLDNRRVIAVNPSKWPDDLRAFFERYYPGVRYGFVEAATPAELTQKLKQL
jgi:hypothetical protein